MVQDSDIRLPKSSTADEERSLTSESYTSETPAASSTSDQTSPTPPPPSSVDTASSRSISPDPPLAPVPASFAPASLIPDRSDPYANLPSFVPPRPAAPRMPLRTPPPPSPIIRRPPEKIWTPQEAMAGWVDRPGEPTAPVPHTYYKVPEVDSGPSTPSEEGSSTDESESTNKKKTSKKVQSAE